MAGTPVLGSPNGGIPELIQEGRTGWICPAEEEELTKTLTQIWDGTEPEAFRDTCQQTRFGNLQDYIQKLLVIYQGGDPNG